MEPEYYILTTQAPIFFLKYLVYHIAEFFLISEKIHYLDKAEQFIFHVL